LSFFKDSHTGNMRCLRAFFILCFFLSTACGLESHQTGSLPAQDPHGKVQNPIISRPLIILDAGHGGTDEGTKVNAFKEKRLTLLTVLLTKKHLEDLGYRVMLTRGRDIFLSLSKRVCIANKAKASLFVSVHYNSAPSPDASGIEVFFFDSKEAWRAKASKRLASCLLSGLINQTDAVSRGVKAGNFHVIRETDMPSVIVEAGFITNLQERQKLKDRAYIERISVGIAQGIDKYIKT
jgi:N-acetylmuramoyl-L-alanine amidase